jgi:hypothetical protein
MPEATDYNTGAVKTSPDGTMVAIRSGLPSPRDWGYISTTNGGGYLSHEEVKDWKDMVGKDGE